MIKIFFFAAVRQYFETACNYIVKKFPLKNEMLLHAKVANLREIEHFSFNDIRYFVERFPFLLTVKEGENTEAAWNELQKQFTTLQCEDLDVEGVAVDALVGSVGKMNTVGGVPKYDRIAKVLKAILTIPHSNAECERIFSCVKKNKTQFRSSMSTKTLENILIVKCQQEDKCYEENFSNSFLEKAKKATVNMLSK